MSLEYKIDDINTINDREWYNNNSSDLIFDYSLKNLKDPFSNIYVGQDPCKKISCDFAKSIDYFINVSHKKKYSLSDCKPRKESEFFWVPTIEDLNAEPDSIYIASEILECAKIHKKKVFIHCDFGLNRSPSQLIYWLMSNNYKLDEAINIIYDISENDSEYSIRLNRLRLLSNDKPKNISEYYEKFMKGKSDLVYMNEKESILYLRKICENYQIEMREKYPDIIDL
jgi:hypothetical protein